MKQIRVLVTFICRKDYKKIILWQIGLFVLLIVAAKKVATLYNNKASIAAMFQALKTPAMVAMLGKFSLKTTSSVASLYAAEMLVFTGWIVALMNISLTFHTLSGQEDSTNEILRALVGSKRALLNVSFFEMFIVNILTAIVCLLALQIANLAGVNLSGSILFSCAMATFGLLFSALTFLLIQLVNSNSATIAYGILGLSFAARMLTDLRYPKITSWTIYGLIERLNVYSKNNWVPVLIMLSVTLIFGSLTILFAQNKDWGQGVIPSWSYIHKVRLISNQFSLIAKLNLIPVIGWSIGLSVLGMIYGSLYGNIANLLKTNPTLGRIIGKSAVQTSNKIVILAFTNKIAVILAILASVAGINLLLKLNSDEQKGYLELIHAYTKKRLQTYLSYLINAYLAVTLIFLCGVGSLILTGQKSSLVGKTDLNILWRVLPGFLLAILLTLSITSLISVVLPRWQKISWLIPLYGIFTSYLGGILKLPKWTAKLTPYGIINNVPTTKVDWQQVAIMLVLVVLMSIISYFSYKHRDLIIN